MNLFFLSILIIVSGGVLSLCLLTRFTQMKMVAVGLIGSGCVIGLVDSLYKLFHPVSYMASFNYLNAFAISFETDGLSAFFLVPIFFVSLLAAIYSFHYMNNPGESLKTAVNYLFFGVLIASMAMVVTASNIITFLLSWELMSLSSFFLVIHNHGSPANRRAGYLYFVFSHVGAMFIFAAFGVMYSYTGSFDLITAATLPESLKITVFVLTFIGFGSKAGIFPLHVWLPHAHPAAPSHISAVMSGVMIKTGIYGILRMYMLLDLNTPLLGEIVVTAGMISGILGVVYALAQHDIKRLLAYSSVENIGIILIGMGIGMIGVSSGNEFMAVMGFAGALLHVMNHSIFKSLLFMGAGMVIHKTGTQAIDAMGGVLKKMKVTGFCFLIGSLAISGLPPFNGFVGEFFIYMGGFKGVGLDKTAFVLSHLAIISLAVIGGLAMACFTKVFGVVFQGEARSTYKHTLEEKEPAMLTSMIILAALCVVIGIFPGIFFHMALKGVSALGLGLGDVPMEPFLTMTGNITSSAFLFLCIFILIFALRTRLFKGKILAKAGTWGCGFTQPTPRMQYTGSSYGASIIDFFKPVAPLKENHPPVSGVFPKTTHYHSQIEDIAEVHMGNVIIRPVLWLFDKLRFIQHGDIHLYIGYILLTIIVLLFFV
ncbi:MAG: hydrogenase [Proteobacteria bacterium]|nr:hydrogenase [Pseudomonadota bacterium]